MAFSARQFGFRFENDDGSESASTFFAAQNTNVTADESAGNKQMRLRIGIEEIGGTSGTGTDDYELFISKNGGAYSGPVRATTNIVKHFDSAHLTDSDATTNRLTGGTGSFIAGRVAEQTDGAHDYVLSASSHTEILFTIEFVAADLTQGDTVDFRVYRNGSPLSSYSVTPRANIGIVYNDVLTESTTPGDSLTVVSTIPVTITESSTPGDVYVTASNANIHAFTRLAYGEIWFVIPTGEDESHTYFTFCVDESQRAQTPVWFKGGINATAIVDDPQLGTDEPWSCLRIGDGASADLVSFDRRADGTSEVDWNLTSSAFYIDEAERRVLIKRFYKDFENQDNDVTLQLLTYDFPSGGNIANPSLTIATGDTTKDFRISGRLMKMKFSGSGKCRLGKPAFDIVGMGER